MCFPAVVADANFQGLSSCLLCARVQKKEREWDILPPACWDETVGKTKSLFAHQKVYRKCDLVKPSFLLKLPCNLQNFSCHLYSKACFGCSCCWDVLAIFWLIDKVVLRIWSKPLCCCRDGGVFFSWPLHNLISSLGGLWEILFSWLLSFWKAAGVFSVSNSLR